MEDLLCISTARWQSQTIYSALVLGVLDALQDGLKTAEEVASKLELNSCNTYRLFRALSSNNILKENEKKEFFLTEKGNFLTKVHPQSIRNLILWRESSVSVDSWKDLAEIVRTGKRSTELLKFKEMPNNLRVIFNEAMSSGSLSETSMVLDAFDFLNSGITKIVDIGGGHGHLLCSILKSFPLMKGVLYELPHSFSDPELLWAPKLGVLDRCEYVIGDIFEDCNLPEADAYIMKHILHDWDDEKCIQILKNIHKVAKFNSRILIAEVVINEPGILQSVWLSHFDIHMMVATGGRERTLKEFEELFIKSGWKFVIFHTSFGHINIIEGIKSILV